MQNSNANKTIVFIRSTRPDTDSRLSKSVNTALKAGFHVVVLAWDRACELKEKDRIELPSGSAQLYLFKKVLPHGGGFKGFFKIIGFNLWIQRTLKNRIKNISIVHACDLDTGFSAKRFCRRRHIKLVYDIYDFYSASRKMPSCFKWVFRKMEFSVINKADATIICSDERREQLSGSKPKTVFVVYNTPDIPKSLLTKASAGSTPLRVAYFGVLSDGRLLLDVIHAIDGDSRFALVIGGIGSYEEKIKAIVEKSANISYIGRQPYAKVLEIENNSDVLFATYDPSIENHKFSAPNKLYEAMALGKPIIVCKGTSVDRLVEKNQIGLSCQYTEESFKQCLVKMLDHSLYFSFSKNCLTLYPEFSYEKNEKTILMVYSSILGGTK